MTGIIILAAGASVRFGKPKQLVLYNEQPLLKLAVETAKQSRCQPIVVVTGAYKKEVEVVLAGQPVQICNNTEWQQGMASSVNAGLMKLLEVAPNTQQVIIMLCDQPYISSNLLQQLIEKKISSGKGIVAAFYNNTAGAPVLFDRLYFNELLLLKGQEGAKKLLIKYLNDVVTIPFPLGAVDIDTVEDYNNLMLKHR